MNAIWHEIRQAFSQLRHSPGFTALAVVILGLGLGVTLYMFTIVKAYMLSPLPYQDAEQIMHLEHANARQGIDSLEVEQRDFLEWRRVQTSFSTLAAFYQGTVNLSDGELPERFEGAFLTPSAFEIAKTPALLGRTLDERDGLPGAAPVIVLGHEVWLNRYNGDPGIIGRELRVNGVVTTVVGVMPEGFRFPIAEEMWLPLVIDPATFGGDTVSVEVFGRLAPGVTLEHARAEFAGIAARLAERYPENRDLTIRIKPFQHEYTPPEARAIISTMFVAVLFVLLIACANVANLILARTVARQKDIALRAALGAGRWRILVHVLTESVVLAVLGAVIAYFLADFGIAMTLRAFTVADMSEPFWVDFSLDARVLVFAALAAVFAGVIAGLAPALRATRTDVNEYLKEGAKGSGASSSRLSRTLVIAEIALSCILLVSSGLLIRSVMNMGDRPLGIEHTEMLTGRIGLPEAQYPDGESQYRFFSALIERLSANPEVTGATAGFSFPGIGGWTLDYQTRDAANDSDVRRANYAGVLDNYADVLGMRLTQGRWFDARDREGESVVVLDAGLAAEAFPDGDALGRQVAFDEPGSDGTRWRTVVGIVEPVLLDEVDDEERGAAFVPLAQIPQRFLTVGVRVRGEPMAFAQTLRETVRELDQDIPVYWVRTLDDWLWAGNLTARIVSTLFGVFALLAVVLAAAGIYGVLAYTVSQRTREIGVRRALGAMDTRILNMVLGQGLFQLGVGLGIGLVCAIGFAHLLSSMLAGVSPFDPFTLFAVSATLVIVAVVASLLPALRAMRVNPMEALRYE